LAQFRVLEVEGTEGEVVALLDCGPTVGLKEALHVLAVGNAELFADCVHSAVLAVADEH